MAELIGRERAVREAVGVFSEPRSVERAVQELLTCGFDRADISLLATERTVKDKLGAYYQDIHSAEDDPDAPRRAWAGPVSRTEGRSAIAGVLGYLGAMVAAGAVFATGGAAAAAIAAGVVGGGATAALGVRLGRLIDDKVGDALRCQLEHGGIVLWVRLQKEEQADCAMDVLRRYHAQDVHMHRLNVET